MFKKLSSLRLGTDIIVRTVIMLLAIVRMADTVFINEFRADIPATSSTPRSTESTSSVSRWAAGIHSAHAAGIPLPIENRPIGAFISHTRRPHHQSHRRGREPEQNRGGVQNIASMIQSIAAAAEEQSAANEEISPNLKSIRATTSQAASAEQPQSVAAGSQSARP